MRNWNAILDEVHALARSAPDPHDEIRKKYIEEFHKLTGRNVIAYYSGWLQKTGPQFANVVSINDEDKNGFMACFHSLDFSKGLDLFIHSPGGDVAATESIVHYIRAKFKKDIRVFVPQISMSGGTMLALLGKEIWMGIHSNLGPIDPQFGSQPARLVLKEFDRAADEIRADPAAAQKWFPIIQQIPPTFISSCELAIKWSTQIAERTLCEGMFSEFGNREERAKLTAERLSDVGLHLNHARHLHRDECEAAGLTIKYFEENQDFQNAILSVHHAFIVTLMNTNAAKIIENHRGVFQGKAIA